MPVHVENKLKARARAKGFKGKRFARYVYGTMNKRGLLESPVSALLVEFEKIDLGNKPGDYGCAPVCSEPSKRIYYPSVYISDRDTPLELPDEGEAVVKYKVRGRSMNERDGKKKHSADLEIHSIDTPSEKETKTINGAAKMLEDLRKAIGFARISTDATVNEIRAVVAAAKGIQPAKPSLARRVGGVIKKIYDYPSNEALGGFGLGAGTAAGISGTALLIKKRRDRKRAEMSDPRLPVVFGKGIKIKHSPFRIRRLPETGEFRVAPTRKLVPRADVREHQSYYATDVDDARNTAADMIRRYRTAAKKQSAAVAEIRAANKAAGLSALLSDIIEFARGDRFYGAVRDLSLTSPGRKHGWLQQTQADILRKLRSAARGESVVIGGRSIRVANPSAVRLKTGGPRTRLSAILSDVIELDSRPRNNEGQFAPEDSEAPGPNTMAAAYGDDTRKAVEPVGTEAVKGVGESVLDAARVRKALAQFKL